MSKHLSEQVIQLTQKFTGLHLGTDYWSVDLVWPVAVREHRGEFSNRSPLSLLRSGHWDQVGKVSGKNGGGRDLDSD